MPQGFIIWTKAIAVSSGIFSKLSITDNCIAEPAKPSTPWIPDVDR